MVSGFSDNSVIWRSRCVGRRLRKQLFRAEQALLATVGYLCFGPNEKILFFVTSAHAQHTEPYVQNLCTLR